MAVEGKERGRTLELALFSLPAAPLLAISLPLGIFLPPHYATHLGLPLTLISLIFVGARVFDLVIDPLVGGWQDRTITRFGRRRLWIAALAPLMMLLVWYAFVGAEPGAPVALILLTLLALYACYAAMMIAHLAWAGEIWPTYDGRTAALGAVQFTGLIGQISMLGLAAFVVISGIGDDAAAVNIMGWTIFCLTPVCVLLAVLFVRENDVPPQPHLGLREAIGAVLSTPTLRRVLAPDLLTGVAAGVQSGLFLFFFQHVLLFWRESQTLLFVYFIAGLVGVPLWVWLGRRIGKHRALQVACLYGSFVICALPFLPKGNFPIVATLMFFGGLPTAAAGILLRAMMADVVDEDEVKTGARRTGLYFGLLLTTNKIGLVAGPLTYVFLDLAHFQAARGAANSDTALLTLSALFIGVPFVLNLIATWSLQGYPLDEARHAALRAEIDAREAAAR